MNVHLIGWGDERVRCDSGKSSGGRKACENMFVHVNDKSRACFNHNGNPSDESPCAVVCATPDSCDEETIVFDVS